MGKKFIPKYPFNSWAIFQCMGLWSGDQSGNIFLGLDPHGNIVVWDKSRRRKFLTRCTNTMIIVEWKVSLWVSQWVTNSQSPLRTIPSLKNSCWSILLQCEGKSVTSSEWVSYSVNDHICVVRNKFSSKFFRPKTILSEPPTSWLRWPWSMKNVRSVS